MKNTILFFAAFLVSLLCTAQEVCDSFSQLKEGTHLEYTEFDKKGKPFSKSSHTTTGISNNAGTITATVKVEVTDLKNSKNNYSNEYGVSCQNGVIAIDMMRFFNSDQMSQFGGSMEAEVDGNALNFPVGASVGDVLDDGYVTVSLGSGGVNVMNMTMNITDRRIEAEETITTPAGTYFCKKMVYKFDSKVGFIKVQGSAEQWYTEDYILVMSKSKNKNGKYVGTSKLTKLEL